MSARPDISVVLPVHNVSHWVVECLSSILEDQIDDLEVIVVDDNSADDTHALVAAAAEKDARLKLVRSTGTGGGEARNLGVELASGEYVVFCDGDDLVPRGAYARMLSRARTTGADMVVGNFLKFSSLRTWRPTRKWTLFREPRIGVTLQDTPSLIWNRACWNRLIRRQLLLDEAIRFPPAPRSNDIVPMTRALVAAKHVEVIPEFVYLYRARPGTASMTARAGDLASFESYLLEELTCRTIIESLDVPHIRAEFFSLFLGYDGWSHLRDFLATEPWSTCDEAALDRARGHLSSMLQDVDDAAIQKLPLERRWVFALALSGCWRAAGRLARSIDPPVEPMPDIGWFLGHAPALEESPLATGLVRTTLFRWVIWPLNQDSHPMTSEELASLAAHADVVRDAVPPRARRRQSLAARQFLLAVQGDRDDIREDLATRGPLRIAGESLTISRRRVTLRVTLSGAGTDDVTIYAVAGKEQRQLDIKRGIPGEHGAEASIPLAALHPGTWSLRFALSIGDETIDDLISVPEAGLPDAPQRPWIRATASPGEQHGETVLAVPPKLRIRVMRTIQRHVARRVPLRRTHP